MADLPDILIRPARHEDVPGLAEMFVAAFPESVAHVAGSLTTNRGLEDMFVLALQAEAGALLVAEEGGRVAGYVLAPARTSRLRSVAIWRGHLLRSAWRWLTGQYGVRWRAIVTSLGDKLSFLRNNRVGESSEARILSMAVHPDYQGKGLGKRLLAEGLDYLRGQGVATVRLEVRPDNAPAKRLYEQAGFAPVGTYPDAQGPWLVMTKHLQPQPRSGARRRRRRKWRRWVLLTLALGVAGWSLFFFLLSRPLYLANMRLRAEMPFLTVPGPGQRVLIVAPHPDDETLGCGGFIQQAREAGAEVYVVLMTNGDASEYSMMYSEKDLVGSPGDYLALGRLRQRESQAGLGVLGVPPQRLYILGFPNGGLDKLWEPDNWLPANLWTSPRTRVSHNPYPGTWRPNAPYCGSQVLAELEGILGAVQPDVILAPMPLDVHPDHWATYDFVKLAVDQRPPSPGPLPRLYTYLVHLKDWPAPLGYHPGALLEPPAAFAHMARVQWWALPLSDQEVKQKISVLSMYRSQGPRWDHVLLALVRHDEIFAEVTPPDSGLPEVSLVDPIKDQPAERRRPGSDLALLAFRSQPASVGVSLSAAGPLEPGLTYAVLGHSPQATGPVAWELRARGKTATLTWVQDNMLHRQALPLIVQPGMLSVALPSALAEGHSLLVEAFSSTGRRYLDHTTTQTIVLGPGP